MADTQKMAILKMPLEARKQVDAVLTKERREKFTGTRAAAERSPWSRRQLRAHRVDGAAVVLDPGDKRL